MEVERLGRASNNSVSRLRIGTIRALGIGSTRQANSSDNHGAHLHASATSGLVTHSPRLSPHSPTERPRHMTETFVDEMEIIPEPTRLDLVFMLQLRVCHQANSPKAVARREPTCSSAHRTVFSCLSVMPARLLASPIAVLAAVGSGRIGHWQTAILANERVVYCKVLLSVSSSWM